MYINSDVRTCAINAFETWTDNGIGHTSIALTSGARKKLRTRANER